MASPSPVDAPESFEADRTLLLEVAREIRALRMWLDLLHEAGVIPTDVYLLGTVKEERTALLRDIDGYVQRNLPVPARLLGQLTQLDTHVRALESLRAEAS